MHDLTKTKVFSSEDMRREMIRSNLQTVIDALNERGYKCHEIQPVDMFPHSVHVENVAWLSRV